MGQQCCTDAKVDNRVHDPTINKPEKVRNSTDFMHSNKQNRQYRDTN